MSTETLEYAQVDVFAEHALEGNMLAIFTDARGLKTAQMQALARETNLCETTFVLPASETEEAERGVRVRIFTTQEELPFAGHPTLGTAAWLYWNHPRLRGAERIVLALDAGRIEVKFQPPAAGELGVFGTMRQLDPVFGETHDRTAVARVLGLSIDDLHDGHPVQTVSTGMAFCIVLLRSLEALGRLKAAPAAVQAYLAGTDAKFFFCMAPAATGSGVDFRNRMQFYNGEDPATGSASGCAIAYLVRHGIVESGRETIFAQGVEMLRPSRLQVSARRDGDKIYEVFVGGRTIAVASGRFFLPERGTFPQG